MPELALLIAVLYVAVSLYRPLQPFRTRREAAIYGIPGVLLLAGVLAMLPPPVDPNDPAAWPQQPQQPLSAPTGLSPQQEQMRLNKLRGRDEGELGSQLQEGVRRTNP